MEKVNELCTYPEHIQVFGLPFMLQGWNNTYVLEGLDENKFPIYYLAPYTLYCLFPIIGVRIKRNNGDWVLQRDCDPYPTGISKQKGNNEVDTPFGNWTYGATVTGFE